MRAAFIQELMKLAHQHERIVLLTGDLGYTVLEPFQQQFPDRFFNLGVAEQNMVGVATGLAEAGYIPYVYSIATFASLRAYEFIRNGPVAQRLPVRIVGIGGGLEYGTAGLSHYGVEDVGLFRLQPDMMVFVPADARQAATMLRKTWNLPQPIYYRISKRDIESIPGLRGRFSLGKLQLVRQGRQIVFLVVGGLVQEVLAAAEMLEGKGVSAAVGVVASLAPPPLRQLRRLAQQYRLMVTVEAHYATGGMGTIAAETIASIGSKCRLVRCGLTAMPHGISGSEPYLWEKYKLSRAALVRVVTQTLKEGVQSR